MNDFDPAKVAPAAHPLADDPEAKLAEMNARYAIIKPGGRVRVGVPRHYDPCLDRHHLSIMTVADFKIELANRKIWLADEKGEPRAVPLSSWWLAHPDRRQHLGGVVCEPGRDLGPDYLNLWQGFTVKSCEGDPSPILEHVRFVASSAGPVAEEYLLSWTARAVQEPGAPGEVAVVLRGKKGCGKGAFGNMLLKLFGAHGFYASHQRDIAGNFNAHLMDACLVFADECFYAGNRQHESTLKAVITEPRLRVEFKGVDVFQAPNRVSLIMSSNKDWIVPATAGERRFFVLDVPGGRIADRAYWDRLWRAINNRKTLGAFLKTMLERDLSGFNVRDVPRTSALDDQKTASFDVEQKWLVDILDKGQGLSGYWDTSLAAVPWEELVPTDTLVRAYEHYCLMRSAARYAMHRAQLGQFLSRYYEKVRLPRPKHGGTRGWGYRFGPIDEARARFCAVETVDIQWDERS